MFQPYVYLFIRIYINKGCVQKMHPLCTLLVIVLGTLIHVNIGCQEATAITISTELGDDSFMTWIDFKLINLKEMK